MVMPDLRYAHLILPMVLAVTTASRQISEGDETFATPFGLPADAPEEASQFLKLVSRQSSGVLWPEYNYEGIGKPGARSKGSKMNMNASINSISFSLQSDPRVFTATKPEKHNSAVSKVVCLFVNRNAGGRFGERLLSFNQGKDLGRARALRVGLKFRTRRQQNLFSWFGTKQQQQQPSESASQREHVLQVLLFDMLDGCSRKMGVHALRRLRCASDGQCQDGDGLPSADIMQECSSEFQALQDVIEPIRFQEDSGSRDVRAVAAGGDGTITWLIDELYKVADPPVKVPVGAIPLGTGNDLSRQLNTPAGTLSCRGAGTANALASNGDLAALPGLVEVLAKHALAPSATFDVWNVVVKTHSGGDLLEMREGKLASIGFRCTKRAGDSRCEEMQQTMGNYASIGFESLIGLEFEKWRSGQTNNTQTQNMMKYVELGAKYTLGMDESPDFPFLKYQPLRDSIARMDDDLDSHTVRSLLSCDPSKDTYVGGPYRSLMFTNVECLGGGYRKWPLRPEFPQPSLDDGLVEALAFRSPLTLGVTSSTVEDSCAIGRYHGPTITFRGEEAMAAFQVDGEYYAGKKLMSMTIMHREQISVIKLGKGNTIRIGNPTIVF
eukprot:TRINITY_DN2196_c0_g1_i2.p1 TRINITY_DN2196_c0_g1~~TRINITY_DN2196_c0_g1_i2.p1  ORF type:complete len:610 (-),score=35.62 TRINITY_DN2196_c0_g1_i2:318-2147(-)